MAKKNILIILFILAGKILFSQSYVPDSITNAEINKLILKKYKKIVKKKKIKPQENPKVFKIFWMHYKNDSSENKKYVLTEELLKKNLVFNGVTQNKRYDYDFYGLIYSKDSLYEIFDELICFYKPTEKYFYIFNIIKTYNIKYAFEIVNVSNETDSKFPVYLVDNKGKIYVFYIEKDKNNKTIYIIKNLKEYKPICCLDLLGKY